MNFPTVLVVNNSSRVLASTRDYLELKGYKVLAAENEEQADMYCSEEVIHVAVVDIRLVDDTDENDKSGLRLAARLSPSIYKIILTGQEYNDPKQLLSGATTSWTEIDHDIVDSLVGQKDHDIVDSFAETSVNIAFHPRLNHR